MGSVRLGAYGIAVEGLLGDVRAGLVDVSDDAPTVTLRREPWDGGDDDRPSNLIDDDHARLRLLAGGWLELDRASATAVFHVPEVLHLDDLVHPYLAPVGGVYARWLGREAFHCGAVLVDGGAWALLGDKEAGKSTFVAWLDTHAVPVLTDDLLVIDLATQPVCHAGPRSVDLRPPTAQALDLPDLEPVRDGERFRLRLGPVPPTAPLRGFVLLEEADEPSIERVAPAQRLEAISTHRVVRLLPRDPVGMLDLAALPTFVLRRPKDWDRLDEVTDLLLAGLG